MRKKVLLEAKKIIETNLSALKKMGRMNEETDDYEDWDDEEPASDDESLDYATELKLNRFLRKLHEPNPKAD